MWGQTDTPQKKLTSKRPSLLGLTVALITHQENSSDNWIAVKSMSSLRRNVIDVKVGIDVHIPHRDYQV